MTEPAELPTRQPVTGRGTEVFLLASLTVLCIVLGGMLHFVADVPLATATLTALACLSILLGANAMVRRATTVAVLNAEIKDLRAEIMGLRSARMAAPHPGTISRPPPFALAPHGGGMAGVEPASHALSPSREPRPGIPQAGGQNASSPYPAHSIPGLPPRQTAPLYRPAYQAGAPANPMAMSPAPPAATPEPAGEGKRTEAGGALDWTLRPGSHREPKAPIVEVEPHSGAAGPLPLIEPHRLAIDQQPPGPPTMAAGPPELAEAPIARASPEATEPSAITGTAAAPTMQTPGSSVASPDPFAPSDPAHSFEPAAPSLAGSFLADLRMPETDGAPRAMARPHTGAWPQVVPKTPTAPLDLGTMQNLIEQLSGQLDPTSNNSPYAEGNPASAAPGAQTPPAVVGSRIPPSLPQRASAEAAMATRPGPAALRDDLPPFGHLALIAEALEARRMDVMLDPILGLADRRARHFELSVRLFSEDGADLDLAQYRRAAAGTGLLGRIDAAKLTGAGNVLKGLRVRGSTASLFSAVAGESLSDDNFANAFADMLDAEDGQATRLVLTFAQSEARNFTDAHWRAVSDLGRVGLKFALTDVTDLDMDFEILKRHGFDFIKLDASVFLQGLPTANGQIPAADICRHLSNLGLALIVGGIVAEKDLARVLGFGALLGQGTLFGGPRCVELERERHAA